MEDPDGPTMEQMEHLCTLIPFGLSRFDPNAYNVTANVSVNFRSEEIRFTAPSGSIIVFPMDELQGSETWLHLLDLPFCKLVGLLCPEQASGAFVLEPVAIRIYLQKDRIRESFIATNLCEFHMMEFERVLRLTLLSTPYTIETSLGQKKRRPQWELSSKQLEIQNCKQICDNPNIYFSFQDLSFTTKVGSSLSLQLWPTALVSGASDTWQETVLSQVVSLMGLPTKRARLDPSGHTDQSMYDAHNCTLIVTNNVAHWTSVCQSLDMQCATVGPRGILLRDLQLAQVILVSVEHISENINQEGLLFDAIEDLTLHVTDRNSTTATLASSPSLPIAQIRRILLNVFCKKFNMFRVPIQLVQFGLCILDNMKVLKEHSVLDFIQDSLATRFIQVLVDETTTKPSSLTMEQTSLLYKLPAIPTWALPHVTVAVNAHLQIVPVSKTILKRFKITGHPIKSGPIEDRIAKFFASKYCPIGPSEALQRFSGNPVPKSIALDLIQKHFDRLSISLGSFLLPAATEASTCSKQFILEKLSDAEGSPQCCICFESLSPDAFAITLCGHTYCSDCARYNFMPSWDLYKAHECANCRCPCTYGDVFFIQNDTSASKFVPVQASKEASIASFLSGLRTMNNVQIWPNGGPKKAYEQPIKHLIVNDICNVKSVELVKALHGPTAVNIHVFYTPNEFPWFHALTESF
jgi:hypothetical protein